MRLRVWGCGRRNPQLVQRSAFSNSWPPPCPEFAHGYGDTRPSERSSGASPCAHLCSARASCAAGAPLPRAPAGLPCAPRHPACAAACAGQRSREFLGRRAHTWTPTKFGRSQPLANSVRVLETVPKPRASAHKLNCTSACRP